MATKIKDLIVILFVGIIVVGGWWICSNFSLVEELDYTTNPITPTPITITDDTENEHFIIHSYDPSIDIKNIKKLSEEAYSVITKDIGLDSQFTGENKIKVYIYQNRKKYQEVTGRPSWSIGCNDEENFEIHHMNFRLSEGIPHELTHLIFKANFPPKKGKEITTGWMVIPNWIHEGFAVYEEQKFDDSYVKNVLEPKMEAFKQGKYLGVEDLTTTVLDNKSLSEVREWYAESLSVVTYLIEEYGKSKFFELCSYLSQGVLLDKIDSNNLWEEAERGHLRFRSEVLLDIFLKKTYPGIFNNMDELTQKWSKWVKTSI